jgi:hypothetical protein
VKRGSFKCRFSLFLFLLLSCIASHLHAQEPTFVASVSGSKLSQHSVFQIQFELQNANGTDFIPPAFKDFSVVGGPSIGSSTMIVNGAVTRSQSWSYSLLAKKEGKFIIGPASVVAGRKKLTTRPISIEVVSAKEVPNPGSSSADREPIVLKAEVNAKEFYPGEQIILTYKLLFRENIQTVSTISEDDYKDFFVQNFSDFSRDATTENINGLPFTARIVKSIALFAHQSGTYTIEPMIMNAGINAPFPGNQGFFTMRRIQDVQVASEPLTITVLPLPPDAPTAFSGAVGQYQIKLLASGKTTITTDEALTFQMEITGNGDSRRWDIPMPVSEGNFETYEPKILQDNVFDVDNKLSNIRIVEYQMIPASTGVYDVFVPLTYFDPELKKYVTITSDTIQVQVAQGSGIRTDSLSQNQFDNVTPTLMQIRPNLLKDKFWTSIPHLILLGFLLSGSGLSVFLSIKRRRESQLPESEKIRLAALHQANSQFDILESDSDIMSGNVFFEKATEIYYKFLLERFAIPSSELDEANLKKYLAKAGIAEELSSRTISFFNQCLTVRYGGIPGGYSRPEMLRQCRELIGLLAP